MSGYWKDSPDNPFNQMSWTRGGGGYDNAQTHESNERRASANLNPVDALPRFATMGVAQAALPAKSLAVVGDNVIRTSGPGSATSRTGSGNAGTGPGVASVESNPGAGGKSSGSRFVISVPGYSPGKTKTHKGKPFTDAVAVDGIKNMPLERTGIGGPQEAPGAISDIGWIHGSDGAYVVTYSDDAKQRTEDDLLAQAQWMFRNVVLPGVGISKQPFPNFLDPDYTRWDPVAGGWRPGVNPRIGKDGQQVLTGGGF